MYFRFPLTIWWLQPQSGVTSQWARLHTQCTHCTVCRLYTMYTITCVHNVKSYWRLHTAHCTVYTKQCTVHTSQCTQQSAHCTLHTAHFTLHTAHFTLHTECRPITSHCTLLTPLFSTIGQVALTALPQPTLGSSSTKYFLDTNLDHHKCLCKISFVWLSSGYKQTSLQNSCFYIIKQGPKEL